MSNNEIMLRLEHGWVTKEELQRMLGGVSERAARDYIAELNIELLPFNKCVLSTSARKGFHIANPFSEEDKEIAIHASKELESKAISIFQRRKALENFIKFTESAKESAKTIQLTLF